MSYLNGTVLASEASLIIISVPHDPQGVSQTVTPRINGLEFEYNVEKEFQ